VVLSTEVVEHLERVDALALMKSMAGIARQWMLATPFSYYFPGIARNMVCVLDTCRPGLKDARGVPGPSSRLKSSSLQ
jgi:hypothetical protein